ncbi:hypothetical protein Taro_004433 [Colocasia esculenta]|uniref:Uncharacterized protein n=1 Tax=Colocasia esculenta TaxID=4460 RepID=A0A843TUX2_COLES|nr:hypothetical protein [Colocasia esculenta]
MSFKISLRFASPPVGALCSPCSLALSDIVSEVAGLSIRHRLQLANALKPCFKIYCSGMVVIFNPTMSSSSFDSHGDQGFASPCRIPIDVWRASSTTSCDIWHLQRFLCGAFVRSPIFLLLQLISSCWTIVGVL